MSGRMTLPITMSRCSLALGLFGLLLAGMAGMDGVDAAGSKITAADLANLNLYKVLGVTAKATSVEIAKAYRKLAIKYAGRPGG